MPHEMRDTVIDFVGYWRAKADIPAYRLVKWIGISASKYFNWKSRYGKVNEHNNLIPRDHWLLAAERQAIVDYYLKHQSDGYRRVTYMMMDEDIVAVSASSVYRVLSRAGVLRKWDRKPTKKGTGFNQPSRAHAHWHIDVTYLNICGTFYYLCSVLDGYSRYIVHHEIREQMKEQDVEIILQRSREKFTGVIPRVISDNGPQFIARDFRQFIRISGMDHVRTSPYYPQSNGKIERWHQSLKRECIRPRTPLSLEEARRIVQGFVSYYNAKRLHSALGYVTPWDKLAGREKTIFADRDKKLQTARERRAEMRNAEQYLFASWPAQSLKLKLENSISR